MKERTEPCKQCNSWDFYTYGKYSSCRPCHNEASKRYLERKRNGLTADVVDVPKRDLEYLLKPSGLRSSHERNKKSCPQGHPYNLENTNMGAQKNGKNVNRKCRVCDRNRKRLYYGLDPEPLPSKLSDMLDSED
jgi:hypothetical protein